ncbi:MAG: tetratricopeptide repeat protein [Phaeodactylibacter sp.]|nr:tetratricopeptide repeat protein [Phaeodactylibacter sp.]
MNNFRKDPETKNLVAAFEEQFKSGGTAFFEEKAYLKIIEFYEQDHQLDKALEAVDYAIAHYSYSADCYIRKAELLICLGKEEDALSVLEQACLYAPMEPEIGLLRAEALAGLGHTAEAREMLEGLKETAGQELLSNIFLVESIAYESEGQHELMYYALKSAIELDPGNVAALERFGVCVELSKKYEESISIHEAILDKDPYAAVAWFNLGQAQAYLGNYEEAISAYEFAFVIDEDFEEAYRECAGLCFELKQYHKSLKYFHELLEATEPDSEIFTSIGQCYFHLGKHHAAITFYNRAIQLDPLNDELFFYIGACHAKEESWQTAIHFFEKAIQVEEQREEYYIALGEAYQAVERMEDAEECFRLAVEANPEESTTWIRLITFLLKAGNAETALEVAEMGEEESGSTELVFCRSACLFAIGRRQEACFWLGEALIEDFEMHRLLFDVLPELQKDKDVISLISAYTV